MSSMTISNILRNCFCPLSAPNKLHEKERTTMKKTILLTLTLALLSGCSKKHQTTPPKPVVVVETTNGTTVGFADCPAGWMVDYDHDVYDSFGSVDFSKFEHLHCRPMFEREKVLYAKLEKNRADTHSYQDAPFHQWSWTITNTPGK